MINYVINYSKIGTSVNPKVKFNFYIIFTSTRVITILDRKILDNQNFGSNLIYNYIDLILTQRRACIFMCK